MAKGRNKAEKGGRKKGLKKLGVVKREKGLK